MYTILRREGKRFGGKKKKNHNVSAAFKNYTRRDVCMHARTGIKQYNIAVYRVYGYIIMRASWSPSRCTWPRRQPVHLSGNNDRFVLTARRGTPLPVRGAGGRGRWPNPATQPGPMTDNKRGVNNMLYYYGYVYIGLPGASRWIFIIYIIYNNE